MEISPKFPKQSDEIGKGEPKTSNSNTFDIEKPFIPDEVEQLVAK